MLTAPGIQALAIPSCKLSASSQTLSNTSLPSFTTGFQPSFTTLACFAARCKRRQAGSRRSKFAMPQNQHHNTPTKDTPNLNLSTELKKVFSNSYFRYDWELFLLPIMCVKFVPIPGDSWLMPFLSPPCVTYLS